MTLYEGNVEARRPDGKVVTVTRNAYERIYRFRGWVRADDEQQGPNLHRMKRGELNDYAIAHGIDTPTDYRNSAELIAALEEA